MNRRIFDSHFHIIDTRFPLVPNKGYLPPEFTAADYLGAVSDLGVTGGAVVSGSFQAFDQSYLIDALATLGPMFVGVANVAETISDDELLRLREAGVRGVRFNLYRGGSAEIESVSSLGRRVWDVAGMHVEFYLDAKDLVELEPVIAALPKVSIDHLGMTSKHRNVLLRLVSRGVRVKATGFGRVELDVASAVREIHKQNPEALMFGTDLPSTRARVPFQPQDVELVADILAEDANLALYENGARFYGLIP
ncbi:putative TIM-barrel fold metal-dependent hydrolase [Arthrobacter sp. V1I9]|uniref:amidohydrolase family protein n=1 Tax=Arthrobacter sp. V1I9 TaxID=3042275 RepID=UPI002793153D|nr:amidohydrolase family protein [Arthrobacter sp. V1I9]MDQ0871097.1 putative TIM-barrel fold metal-dependent hydrolase [Arthrobacter sp. V1I9]